MAKLADRDVVRLRDLAAEGWSQAQLVDEFGVSRSQVSRLLRGDRRAAARHVSGDVSEALGAFLASVELRPGDRPVAAMAVVLAGKLDSVAISDTVGAAQAAPLLATRLAELVRSLEPEREDLAEQVAATLAWLRR
jgi:transcriptional regulator with XRE-family HTH domain